MDFCVGMKVDTKYGPGVITAIRTGKRKTGRIRVMGDFGSGLFSPDSLQLVPQDDQLNAKKCGSGKRSFETYAKAQNSLIWLMKKEFEHKRAYKCQECGMWHLTSKPHRNK